jgi:hypothetical protein
VYGRLSQSNPSQEKLDLVPPAARPFLRARTLDEIGKLPDFSNGRALSLREYGCPSARSAINPCDTRHDAEPFKVAKRTLAPRFGGYVA